MGLRELGIPAIAITSLTPKEDISEAMKELDNSSSTLRLVYGEAPSGAPCLLLISHHEPAIICVSNVAHCLAFHMPGSVTGMKSPASIGRRCCCLAVTPERVVTVKRFMSKLEKLHKVHPCYRSQGQLAL